MLSARVRFAIYLSVATALAFPLIASAAAGTLQMSANRYRAMQGFGVKVAAVNRLGGSSGAVSVICKTFNGTVIAGRDYTAVTRTLTWANGDSTAKNCDVPLISQAGFDGRRDLYVQLSSPWGAALGSESKSTVSIRSSGAASQVFLGSATYSVTQNAGSLKVTVKRSGAADAAKVAYATANSSAAAGTDYTAEHGALSWSAGDLSSRTFTIPISNAKPFGGTRTFGVAIASPSGVGMATSSAVVSILGDAASRAKTGTATLTWSAPTTDEAGTVLTNLAGFKISYGTSATALTRVVQIANPKTVECELQALGPGTWYFAVSAYTTTGAVSPQSLVVTKNI